MRKRWREAKLFLIAAALLLPMPQERRAVSLAFDLIHAPLFAALAFFAAKEWQARRAGATPGSLILVSLALACLGAAMELLQGLVGRFPSWHDALANALGACAGGLLFRACSPVEAKTCGSTRKDPAARRGRSLGAFALVAAASLLLGAASWSPAARLVDCYRQWRDFPLLSSFESTLELSRWNTHDASSSRSPAYATQGQWSLRLDLSAGKYPGMESRYLPGDWSAFEELVFDVALQGGPELQLFVKIYDESQNQQAKDRFQEVFPLVPGAQRIRISLAEVARAPEERSLDLRRIARLQFFTIAPKEPKTLFFDNIHLRRAGTRD